MHKTYKRTLSGNAFPTLRGATIAAALFGYTSVSLAQTPPAPQPSPAGAGSSNPYADPTIGPSVQQALDKITPPVFKPPINNGNAGGGEAEAFSELVSLSDKYGAAIDAEIRARACGSAEDIKKAEDALGAAQHAYYLALDQYIKDYSSTLYTRAKGRPESPALTAAYDKDQAILIDAIRKASKYVSPPMQACSPRQDTTGNPPPRPQPVPPPPGPAPTPFSQILGIPVNALVAIDYKYYEPSAGDSGHGYGGTLGIFPRFSGRMSMALEVGYASSDPPAITTTTWTLGASPVWSLDNWRFGPAVGWQSNSTLGRSIATTNYGGFAEWFATPDLTASTKIGGFSSSTPYDGFYLSGALKWYTNPNLALNAGIDFTRVDNFGGSSEADYSLGGEYLLSEKVPVSLFATYSFSDHSTNYHVSSFNIGFRFYISQDGVSTLVDHQRTGLPLGHQFRF